MQVEAQSNDVVPRVIRRADVTGVVQVDAIDRTAADRCAKLVRALAGESAPGPIEAAEAYDELAARLTLTVTGSLSAVLCLLNGKSPSGERLIEELADTSLVASVDDVGAERAITISDHLLSA